MYNLEEIIQRLLSHPYFKKAKHVKELNPGHPEDSVFTHSVQTADFIKEHLSGDFIANREAKKLFQDFMNKKTHGVPFADIAVVTGLVHDIGKILSYREAGKVYPMNQPKPNSKFTYCPSHGYYGSLIVKPLLTDVGMKSEVVDYIATIVRLHLLPFDFYQGTSGFAMKDVINDLKPRMEGLHIEVCINAYADIAYNPRLRDCWELLKKMLEEPHFYDTREYFIA